MKEHIPAVPLPERDAIQDLLREGELEGVGEREEIAIISGVVEFSEKIVRDVMTPRSEMFALPSGVDPHTLASQIAQSRYSRVPIYDGALDNIIGMVHAFDVIKAHGEMPERIRPVAFSTAAAPCNELLFRMLRERLHLAIVRDGARDDRSGHPRGPARGARGRHPRRARRTRASARESDRRARRSSPISTPATRRRSRAR